MLSEYQRQPEKLTPWGIVKRRTRLISASLLALAAIFSGSPSLSATADPISVVGENDWTFPLVPQNLPWGRSALNAGNQAIDALSIDLSETVESLRDAGAIRIVTLKRALPDPALRNSGLKASALRFVGIDASGNATSRSDWWPGTQAAFANTLVTLNVNKCSLRGFNLLDWGTWFETRCEIVKPTAEQFLRAQLAAQISFGSGNAPDMLRYELEKLRAVLVNGWSYRISGSVLTFDSAADQYGTNTVWLGELSQWYGYRISINRQAGTATLRYARPNFREICKVARFEGNEGILVF